MSTAARGNPKFNKGGNSGFNPNHRGRSTWRSGPQSFSQPNHGNLANRNSAGPGPNQHGFPNGPNHPPLHLGLNSTIIVITRDNVRHRGVLASIDNEGFILRNYRKLSTSSPGPASLPTDAVQRFSRAALLNWHRADGPISPSSSGPPTSGSGGPPSNVSSPRPGFLTDQDISQSRGRGERDLTPWSDGSSASGQGSQSLLSGISSMRSDEATFGASATGKWDQFAANESMFGVTTDYNEELYTTKIDSSRPDFHEKERQAAQMAKEIEKSTTSNVHQAEERNQVDDSGANEEDKYGAVQRTASAYIPPGARSKQDNGKPPIPATAAKTTAAIASSSTTTNPPPETAKVDQGSVSAANAPKKDAVGSFHDFISAERQRLQEKKQQIVKKEKDQKIADLRKFSQGFKLKSVIPSDLVQILAKTEDKQKELIARTKKDADSSDARVIQKHVAVAAPFMPKPVDPPPVRRPFKQDAPSQATGITIDPPSAAAKQAMRNHVPGSGSSVIPRTGTKMVLQPIPPFRGKPTVQKSEDAPSANGASPQGSGSTKTQTQLPANGVAKGSPKSAAVPSPTPTSSSAAATKLSAKATSFRPNPNALSFTPGVTSPPGRPPPQLKPETAIKAESIPPKSHPFFGHAKIIPSPVPIKEEFNPFKTAKVAEASQAGKPYMKLFAPLPPMPSPRPQPSQSFVEDPAAAAAARAPFQYIYPQLPFGPQGPVPMMNFPQNMPGGGFPPGHFVPPGQFHPQQPGSSPVPFHPQMQHGMPPAPGFMPQGGHFTPHANGGPRSNIGSPMPQNAYYQSPQMSHALPPGPVYPMMMGQQQPQPGQHPPPQQIGAPFHFDNQHAPHAGMMSPRQSGATAGPNTGPNMR